MLNLSVLHVDEVVVEGLGDVVLVDGQVVVFVTVLDCVGGNRRFRGSCCSMFSCQASHQQHRGQHCDNHFTTSLTPRSGGSGHGEARIGGEEEGRMEAREEEGFEDVRRGRGGSTSTYSNSFLTEACTRLRNECQQS